MSETVSFRCTGELVEFLEQEAERRMTTKSSVAQMLLAEKFREAQTEDTGNGESTGDDTSESGLPEIFERHADKWYRPDSHRSEFAVQTPEDKFSTSGPRYFKTADGAATGLKRWWENRG